MTELTVEDWIKRGYKRYEISERSREINKLADFMLQKRFDDEKGKKYFITVYCYDRTRYPQHVQEHSPAVGFMPTVQFNLGDGRPFFNIEMNAVRNIDEVEKYLKPFGYCSTALTTSAPMDKLLHAVVGAAIAATPVTPQQALGLVVLAAVGKELHDRRRGGDASGLDALATIAGGAPVITVRWEW